MPQSYAIFEFGLGIGTGIVSLPLNVFRWVIVVDLIDIQLLFAFYLILSLQSTLQQILVNILSVFGDTVYASVITDNPIRRAHGYE